MIEILNSKDINASTLLERKGTTSRAEAAVAEIIADVAENGDAALLAYCEKFDKAKLSRLEVAPEEIEEAFESTGTEFLNILREAAENIEAFHRRQVTGGFVINDKPGIILGQKVTPLQRAGVYVPGGTASYPSTVLMNCIPAKIAGVEQVFIATPPRPDGKIDAPVLAAAKIAGADRVFKMGGAQAIAALAYGTQSVPKVDKIVGPGNVYVAQAKRQVFGLVDIDMIAGPSEILIIADGTADPVIMAADLLSQAEHDANASAILITDCAPLAKRVQRELEEQIPNLPRASIARASIDENGKIIVASSLDEAVQIANEIAPEHLEVYLDNPFDYLSDIKNAGSIFLGKYCPEALGDYFSGTNHTLPTNGTARFSSPLSVDDFVKKSCFSYYTRAALEDAAAKVDTFAQKEGLTAHGSSVTLRFRERQGECL